MNAGIDMHIVVTLLDGFMPDEIIQRTPAFCAVLQARVRADCLQ